MMDKLTRIYETNLAGYNVAKQLKSIDENAIYLVKDEVHNTKSMYRGENKVGGDFIIEDTKPSTPETGIIYCIKNYQYSEDVNGLFLGVYENGKWLSFFDDLITKMMNNELVTAKSIEKLASAAGTIKEDDSIGYIVEGESNYIKNATSVHNATVILDNKLKEVEETAGKGGIKDVKVNDTSVLGTDKVANISLTSETVKDGNKTLAETLTAIEEQIGSAGKVDDVKVNGVSVLDGNKIANISITTESIKDGEKTLKDVIDDKIENINVNGVDGTVTDKKANVIINGDKVNVADKYTVVEYDEQFNHKAQHVQSTDKVSEAFKKVENTIKTLVSEVIIDEEVTTAALIKIKDGCGFNENGEFDLLEKEVEIIKDSTDVTDALVKLDKYTNSHGVMIVDGLTPINPKENVLYYISQFVGKREEEEEEEHMPIHFIGYYDPNKIDHKGHKGDWVRMVKDFVIINGRTPSKPEPNVLYYISEYSHDDESAPYHFLGFYDETKGDWVYAAHDWTKTIAALQDGKQDTLKPGHGIEIEEDGTINATIDVTLYEFVDALPTPGDPTINPHKIYIVEKTDEKGNIQLYEYIYHDDTDTWQELGKNHTQLDLSGYLTKVQSDERYMPKSGKIVMLPSGSVNPEINLLTNGSQAFLSIRVIESGSVTGKAVNGAAFGTKLDGTAAFLHKGYDSVNPKTGALTGATNTAVLTFSGKSGLRYAKNSKTSGDVPDTDYRYVGVIDSPDAQQCVYSKKQVDDLLKTLTDKIASLEAQVAALSK